MSTLSLAARNLRRNMRRTLLTGVAIAFGLAIMIVAITLQEGTYQDMVDKGIGQLAGHVVVQAPGWQDGHEPEDVVRGASAIAAAMRGAFPEARVAPRLQLGGLLSSSTNSVGAGLQGLDPVVETGLLQVPTQIQEGAWLEGGDLRGIVIGRALADSLGVGVGDKLVFIGQFGGAEVQSRLFRVRGIFRSGAAEMDGFLAFCDLAAAQDLLGMGDVAHMITLHLADAGQSTAAKERVKALLAGDDVEVLTWREALPELYALIQVDRSSGDVMFGILGIIVAMGVLNTMLMSVLERTREFGVMLAVGMRPAAVSRLVLAEGLVLGLVGATVGVGAGLLLAWPLVSHGIDYASLMGGETMEMSGIAMSTLVHGRYGWWRIGLYTVGAVAFTVLAAAWPAVHVARLRPVDAMRHV